MLDLAELRRRADGCISEGLEWVRGDPTAQVALCTLPERDFIIVASPATILALLDRLEAAERVINATHVWFDLHPGAWLRPSCDCSYCKTLEEDIAAWRKAKGDSDEA